MKYVMSALVFVALCGSAIAEETSSSQFSELSRMLGSEFHHEQDRAIAAFHERGGASVPHLKTALESGNPVVTANAAEALGLIAGDKGRIGYADQASILESLDKARSSDSWYARWMINWSLGRFRHEKAFEFLQSALSDENQAVRTIAVSGIGYIRDPRSIESLAKMLEDPYRGTRQSAAEGLGKTLNDAALAHLYRALTDSEWSIRVAALDSIEKIGNPESAERIRPALQDRVDIVRNKAGTVFRNLTDESGSTTSIGNDLKSDSITLALWTLGKVERKKIAELVPTIAEVVERHKNAEPGTPAREDALLFNWRAARVLGELRTPECLAILDGLANDRSYIVKVAVVSALSKFGSSDEVKAILRRLANDESALVKERVASALAG
ncbi:MAG: HEAT repeat domain-containing protein [Planctomycetes bacterium]|nr:HEAT repeat domain-containing protein [Planctomycetota bacterium]